MCLYQPLPFLSVFSCLNFFCSCKTELYAVKIHFKINVKQIHTAERKPNELLKVLIFGFYVVDKCSKTLGSMQYHRTATVSFIVNVHVQLGFDISRSEVVL